MPSLDRAAAIQARMLRVAVVAVFLCAPLLAQQPLRIFIRSSEKTHGAGPVHDYPAFLSEWKALLAERGAAVDGDKRFPTDEELAKTDVLLVYSSDGGNVAPDERTRLDTYLKRGGGMVIVHDAMCGNDALWQASVIGAAKQHGERNSHAGKFTLTFTDRSHPIVGGIADLEMNDEMFFLLRAEGLKPEPDGKPVMWTYGMKVSPENSRRRHHTRPCRKHRSANVDLRAYDPGRQALSRVRFNGRARARELLLA